MDSTGWEISPSSWARKGPRPARASPAFPAPIGALALVGHGLQVVLWEILIVQKIVTLADTGCILLFLRTTAHTHATDWKPKSPHLALLNSGWRLKLFWGIKDYIPLFSYLGHDCICLYWNLINTYIMPS